MVWVYAARAEPDVGASTRDDINQLITEVTAVINQPPPAPLPPAEADNIFLQLLPEEALQTSQRIHARWFITRYLVTPAFYDTHWQQDLPAHFTPEQLIAKHTAFLKQLFNRYPRTNPYFSLTHLLGAVKREYGRVRYLQKEEGRTAKERIIFAERAATFQTMQNLVVVARLRAGEKEQGREGE
jgi:hypothetical protein